jgi:hypothetical protein
MDIVTFVWYHHVQEKKDAAQRSYLRVLMKKRSELFKKETRDVSNSASYHLFFLSPSSLTINHENAFN